MPNLVNILCKFRSVISMPLIRDDSDVGSCDSPLLSRGTEGNARFKSSATSSMAFAKLVLAYNRALSTSRSCGHSPPQLRTWELSPSTLCFPVSASSTFRPSFRSLHHAMVAQTWYLCSARVGRKYRRCLITEVSQEMYAYELMTHVYLNLGNELLLFKWS